LDILLEKKIQEYAGDRSVYSKVTNAILHTITLDDADITQLKKVYLFKNEQDLKDL
jgi:hypothetical protein